VLLDLEEEGKGMQEAIIPASHENWTQQEIHLILNKAFELYQQGQYRDADILFEGLVTIDPENRYCYLALSAVRASAGDLVRAVEVLSQWIKFRGDDAEARARRCELLFRLGQMAEGRFDFEFLRNSGAEDHWRRLDLLLNRG